MSITNSNTIDDKLVDVWSNIAEFTEIHQNYIDPDDGMMMMRKVSGIDALKESVSILSPKGHHIMFINLKQRLEIGQSFPLTLVFEKMGEQIITVDIVAPGTTPRTHH